MALLRNFPFDDVCKRGSLREQEIEQLRRGFYEDGVITFTEAEALVRLNRACRVQPAAWSELYIEALCDFIVNDAEPQGYLTAANADWLIGAVAPSGCVEAAADVELLVKVLERARWSPERLVRFALEQVKHAVISGTGPLRSGLELQPGVVVAADVELLRRILFAFGGDGNIGITRSEAAVLFDINDATAGASACPAWSDLFVKAIAGMVLQVSGYQVPAREEALRREAWLDSRGELSAGAVLAGMARSVSERGLDGIWSLYRQQTREECALARLDRQRIEIITNEAISGEEADWLAARIGRDGRLHENERALVAYLEAEGHDLHPSIQAMIGRLANAA